MAKLDTYFTPVLDQIVAEHDRETALTWGVIWRLSQKHGHTTARHGYMADIIGQGLRSFRRRLKALLEAGMVEDLDPDLKGGIHRYRTLRYTVLPVAVVLDGPADPEEDPEGLGQSGNTGDPCQSGNTPCQSGNTPCHCGNTPCHCDLGSAATVTGHDDISHDTSHDTSHDMPAENAPQVPADPPEEREPPPKPERPDQVFFKALAAVCDYDLAAMTEEQRGQVNQSSGILRNKAKAQAGDLVRFREWWDARDWRGKKGESPTPSQVRETWAKYTRWLSGERRKEAQAKASQEAQQKAAQAAKEAQQAEEAKKAAMDPHMVKALATWEEADRFLQGSMTRQTYTSWIAPLVVLKPNGSFRLGAKSEAVHEWIENRLSGTIERALEAVVGRPVSVEYVLLEKGG